MYIAAKGKKKLMEVSPNTTGALRSGATMAAKTIRMQWKEVYDRHYIPLAGADPASFGEFCRVRKKYRPYYLKHRKAKRKMKWNHMECTKCVLLEKSVKEAKTEIAKDQFKAELNDHWENQENARDNYVGTIWKAALNEQYDFCGHFDGAGTLPTSYAPYYPEDIGAGEKPFHKMLKTHTVFAKVHNWGRWIYQSYPKLEPMSANLTIEVCAPTNHVMLK